MFTMIAMFTITAAMAFLLQPTLASLAEERAGLLMWEPWFKETHGWANRLRCKAYYWYDDYKHCKTATDLNASRWLAHTYDGLHWPGPVDMYAKYLWLEDDTITANCLINLHHTQNTECISVEGSVCEKTRGTSKIMNSRALVTLNGDRKRYQISAEDSGKIQEGSRAMIGQKVNSHGNSGTGITSGVLFESIERHGPGDNIQTLAQLSIVFEGAAGTC